MRIELESSLGGRNLYTEGIVFDAADLTITYTLASTPTPTVSTPLVLPTQPPTQPSTQSPTQQATSLTPQPQSGFFISTDLIIEIAIIIFSIFILTIIIVRKKARTKNT